jgi:hypothetical protein
MSNAKWDFKRNYWVDPHDVTLRDILVNARRLIASEDYSVRDAIYDSAVNGESDAAAIKIIFNDHGCNNPVMPKEKVLEIFDDAISELA